MLFDRNRNIELANEGPGLVVETRAFFMRVTGGIRDGQPDQIEHNNLPSPAVAGSSTSSQRMSGICLFLRMPMSRNCG